MILRTCRLYRIIGNANEEIRAAAPSLSGINYTSKRYAGHSQYANRKHTKEVNGIKRGEMIRKYQFEIYRTIRATKDGNPATNNRLQAIMGEAMKNNIPKASLESTVKRAASTLGRDCINQFVYLGPHGIISLIEVSSIHREQARAQTSNVTKKYGFRIANNAEVIITSVGIITCKRLENVQNPLDKAVEDAIVADCEEVVESDDNYIEFQCHTNSIDPCAKKLTNLGYSVENSETRYFFPETVEVNDETVCEMLDKMEEKLQSVPGFIGISFNINK